MPSKYSVLRLVIFLGVAMSTAAPLAAADTLVIKHKPVEGERVPIVVEGFRAAV